MPSWQAKCLNASARWSVRRRDWGDAQATARRARRVFGTPSPFSRLRTIGLRLSEVTDNQVRGEWLEPKSPNSGVILYLHGGGYVSCSPATHRPITAALTRLTNRRTFSLDYRLAPEHPFPAALDDAFVAYQWLLKQGQSPNQMAVAGDSAGGGLALSLLLRLREAGLPQPSCVVCFSPWTDMRGTGESARTNDGRCSMFHTENLAGFATACLGKAAPENVYASPVYADLSGLPPVLLQVSSTEVLLDDSRRIHDKIQAAQGISKLEIYDDLTHCWQMLDGLVPEARQALQQAAHFISENSD